MLKEWDPAWEGTHKERLRYQNDIDFLELSKAKDPTQFAGIIKRSMSDAFSVIYMRATTSHSIQESEYE
jgi:hypothetical protein